MQSHLVPTPGVLTTSITTAACTHCDMIVHAANLVFHQVLQHHAWVMTAYVRPQDTVCRKITIRSTRRSSVTSPQLKILNHSWRRPRRTKKPLTPEEVLGAHGLPSQEIPLDMSKHVFSPHHSRHAHSINHHNTLRTLRRSRHLARNRTPAGNRGPRINGQRISFFEERRPRRKC